MRTTLAAGALALALSFPLASQQMSTPPFARVASTLDSGYLHNSTPQARVVFSQRIKAESAPWMQLWFGEQVNLPAGSFLRMTATDDADVQRHDARSLVTWGGYSAAFNGDEVVLELVAGPNTRSNRVTVAEIFQGLPPAAGTESLCGADDRVPSTDPRQGRLWLGCTGWLAGQDIMLTAGHCQSGSAPRILEMNVPLSSSTGSVRRAAVNDQYPYSILSSLNSGIGADWQVTRMGPNSNTGLLPTQANGGQWYSLGTVPNATAGQNIRITGYGTVSSPISPTWNQVQKTHFDALTQIASTYLRYIPDTTGGNSGSPVIHENTGAAIGIHTHAGCTSGGNHGTRIDRSDLQRAINNAGRTPGQYMVYGSGCAGSGSSGGQCASVNGNGGNLTNSTAPNEYAYVIPNNAPLQVLGFEVFSASTTGSNATVNAALYLDAGGSPATTPVATTSVTIGGTPGFYTATFGSAVNVPAGTFYIAVDHSATNTYISNLSSGNAVGAYWRRPPMGGGTWSRSGIATTPAVRITCAGGGSGGATPAIAGTGTPEIGQTMGADIAFAAANTGAILFTGVSNTTSGFGPLPFALDVVGAPGCSIHASLDIDIATTTDGNGAGGVSFGVPNSQPLIGLNLYHQWVVFDPTVNNLGIVVSNALATTIGG